MFVYFCLKSIIFEMFSVISITCELHPLILMILSHDTKLWQKLIHLNIVDLFKSSCTFKITCLLWCIERR